jgi:hypothetical protein
MMDEEKIVRFPVTFTRYRFREEITIPRRPWIMRGLLLRGQVTTLLASGGVGKSNLGLTIGMHLCAGRNFGPWKTDKAYRVACLSVEEDAAELDRRLHAIKRQFNFTQDDAARFFTITTADAPILAVADRRGRVSATKIAEEIERLAFREEIDVLILDPFAEIWLGIENDNAQVRQAAAIIREITRHIDAATLLMHHTKKGTVAPGDIDAGRGASSLSGLVRIGFTLVPMTADDAAQLNIPSAKGLVRADAAKGNYLAAADAAHWFKFEDIRLDNAEGDKPGDHVGVLVPWAPPGLFENVTYEQIDAILEKISAGMDGGKERYTLAPQSKDRFAGMAVVEVLECTEERAARIIKTWKKSGLLIESEYTSFATRKSKKGCVVDPSKRPSATSEEV